MSHCQPLIVVAFAYKLTQILFPVYMHYRIHPFPTGNSSDAQRFASSNHSPHSGRLGPDCVVLGCWNQHSGRLGSCEESCRNSSIPIVCVLRGLGVLMLH